MKLTESRIKEIILEEIQAISEEEQASDDQAQNKEQGEKDETKSGRWVKNF